MEYFRSLRERFRIPWEERRKANITEIQKEIEEALQADTCSGMWRCSPSEPFRILLHCLWLYPYFPHSFFEEFGIVYTLATG